MVKYTIDQIIDAGRKTYAKYGEGFKMSDVAKELNTKASSLYRHVATKRELYFAIVSREFKEFSDDIDQIVSQMVDPTPKKIIMEIGKYILKIARENTEQFHLMFLTKAPKQGAKLLGENERIGKYESECNPQTIGALNNLVIQHLKSKNLNIDIANNLTFFLVSLIVGAGVITSPIYEHSNEGLLKPEQYEDFHNFVIANCMKLWSI